MELFYALLGFAELLLYFFIFSFVTYIVFKFNN